MAEILCRMTMGPSPTEECYLSADATLSLYDFRQLITQQFCLAPGFQIYVEGQEITLPEHLTAILSFAELVHFIVIPAPEPEDPLVLGPAAMDPQPASPTGSHADVEATEDPKPLETCSEISHPEGKPIVGVRVSGFSNGYWSCIWERQDEDFNDQPVFRGGGSAGKPHYLYYRKDCWVIDESICQDGPVLATGQDFGGEWDVHHSWEVDENIAVSLSEPNNLAISGFPGRKSKVNGTYVLAQDSINGKPHYVLRNNSPNELHLFYSCGWMICPKAGKDDGCLGMCTGPLPNSQWKRQQPSKQEPTFKLLASPEIPPKEAPQVLCSYCAFPLERNETYYQCVTCKDYRICEDCEGLPSFHEESNAFIKLRVLEDDCCLEDDTHLQSAKYCSHSASGAIGGDCIELSHSLSLQQTAEFLAYWQGRYSPVRL